MRFPSRVGIVLGLSLLATAIMLLVRPFPQPPEYHQFADQRPFWGIPHFGNVISNLPFIAVGAWGMVYLIYPAPRRHDGFFLEAGERWPYLVFFLCIGLTGFGSMYYHARPNNDRLLWDRLPLAMGFMALFAILIAERIERRSGLWLFVPLIAVGASSVIYWHQSELAGQGDLRFYLLVQFLPLVALPLMLLLFPPRYTRSALVWYAVAKVLELLDTVIYAQGQIVSGHTLKHLVAGGSAYLILHMIQRRRPIPLGEQRATGLPP